MSLAVLHARGRVGTLLAAERELVFAYDADWRLRDDAFALSPRLPLREEPHAGDEVLYFFANLLPEGPVLDALCALRRLPRGNTFRLLEAFGRECAGAFEIVPEDEAAQVGSSKLRYQPYTSEQLAEDLARLRQNVPLLQSHGELRLSLAGAQNKIPVRYAEGALWLPMQGAPSTHILKPSLQPAAEFPHSVLNEAFCLRLAGTLGLAVPDTVVLRDPEPLLLIARYDRVADGERIERLHQLDFCQLSGVLPAQKYEVDGGPGFGDCFALVDRHSALPAADRLRLVDWLIVNYLIGNADAHAKNLSMLHGADGRLRLAPAYDLLCLGLWPGLSQRMAMAIGGERRPEWVHARHWQRLCATVGLNLVQLRRRALQLGTKALATAPPLLTALDAPPAFVQHATTTLAQRAGWLDQRLVNATEAGP